MIGAPIRRVTADGIAGEPLVGEADRRAPKPARRGPSPRGRRPRARR
jgi:hypothetical protein